MNNDLVLEGQTAESTRTGDVSFPFWTAISGFGLATLAATSSAVGVDVDKLVDTKIATACFENTTLNAEFELAETNPSWREGGRTSAVSAVDFNLLREIGRVGQAMAEASTELEPELRGIMMSNRRRHYL